MCTEVSCKENFVAIVFANEYVQFQEKPVDYAFPNMSDNLQLI
jgi:hypothetical protein